MELVVISGKGGTGKTTIATALSELFGDVARIDCDVDASNFFLYYQGENIEKEEFIGEKKALINQDECIKCGKCMDVCRYDAINFTDEYLVDSNACEGCNACVLVCPTNAISLVDEKSADTFITQLENGFMSRAEMEIGSDGSGKLITDLREKGKKHTKENQMTILDGSPGIGCQVISSITNTDYVLIVTESTLSGLEDLKRIVSLCKHFNIPSMVCINKYDINERIASEIEDYVNKENLNLVGKIPFDDTVMKSINQLKPITTYKDSIANKAIYEMWGNIKSII